MDVFARIGFEPLCKPRAEARLAGVPDEELPEPCGQCPQERFLALPDKNLDVLYGGAGGGGKSAALFAYTVRACFRYPGLQVFWFRESFPELETSVLRLLARFGYLRDLGCKWNGGKYELRFPGGSILRFAHVKSMKEAAAFSSAEMNLLILDERTTLPPEAVDFLYTRVRSGAVGVPCLGIRAASNPGFVGHLTVKEGWVDATNRGAKTIVDAAGRPRCYIPAKVSDNPYVGDYAETLQGVEDPDLRRRILDGDWSVMPNQAFPDWKHDRVVVPAIDLPNSWLRYGGIDYGWRAPSVYLLAARDGDGRVWFYRELVMTQTPEREQARRVLALEDVSPCLRAADPAMVQQSGADLDAKTQFGQEGVALHEANHDRFTGKQRVHQYLAEAPACRYHREVHGWTTCPMVHVVESGCPEFIRCMENLPRDPKRQEDVDTKANDHAYDAARYLLVTIGSTPQLVTFDETDEELRDPLVPEEERLEQYGPVAAPGGAFAIGGSNAANELDPAVIGGQVNPFR